MAVDVVLAVLFFCHLLFQFVCHRPGRVRTELGVDQELFSACEVYEAGRRVLC